ncbi:Condensin complex subunit [Sesamum angolense]|uniref:Condensin complex subunit n=1 Tax=Sesamum angolense TaxID=2727404 RepID=A0AAE1XI36_9LAMI|nr:Condensin complex subunit [Sesamum angolense]
MANEESEEQRKLSLKIARLFDEVWTSQAAHVRKLKELVSLRSSSPLAELCEAFCRALTPLFNYQRRTASAERIIKFAAVFACSRGGKGDSGDEFLENFLKFLLVGAAAANKTVRFRACQIVSEIIMRLPDDAEVSNELWDEVIECMRLHVADKVPAVRTFAVRALARFANDSENGDVLELFLERLPVEQNGDVRKIIVLSLPPSSATLPMIFDCTLDVNESVRKAAYSVLACKVPLQSLSIKHRTNILQRGLTDRSTSVAKDCVKLLKDEWLEKCCNGDPVELLKFLDVETYESVGELVMTQLANTEDTFNHSIELMDPEVALSGEWSVNISTWKQISFLMINQTKGSDAAMTMGTESVVYAAEASDNNDLLDSILPASVSEYVELVNAHIAAGANYRFVSRQLLLLGAMLDFSDASKRKVASEFVQNLLHMAIDHELDDNGNEVFIGDGLNLGGERDWAAAVAELAKKVHAAIGEFEEVVLAVVEELARPCRERTADCKQWLHCLAVIALLLENTTSFRHMQGRAIDPAEILHSILLPGAKHASLDVQRASVRCLGLFGLLERKPSENTVKQLRCSFVKGPPSITIMASKALLDLGIWHGPDEMDKAMKSNLSSQLREHKMPASPVEFGNGNEDLDIELLDLLYAGLEHDWGDIVEVEENQSIHDILGEGLAKILLLSNKFPGSHASTHDLLLAKLITLYFNSESEELQRLKQCLSVFFEHYPSLSANHKKCLSKAFMRVMRSLWPGINGNVAGSTLMVSNMRKRAVQASRFMLQMMQVPLFTKETAKLDDNKSENHDVGTDPSPDFESGEEGLAIRIAVEVASFHAKKTAAEKAYLAALCRILVLLEFRVSEQGAIKLMRRILNRVISSVATEKELTKELWRMAERLQAIDRHPDEKLSTEQTDLILGCFMPSLHIISRIVFAEENNMQMLIHSVCIHAWTFHDPVSFMHTGKLELAIKLDDGDCMEVPPTPAPHLTRQSRARRRAKDEESSSDDELSPTSVVPSNPPVSRSQRASKTAALSRMTAKTSIRIEEDDDEDEDDEDDAGSEVTSDDDSEPFD